MCVQIQSDKTGELFKAMCLVQAEMGCADASINPHFKSKYARLEDVVAASRPTLTKHGIAIMQQPLTHDDGTDRLVTWVSHGASDQFLKGCITINHDKRNVQDLARYITYLKRISYASMVGIVLGEEDDDAEGTQSVKDSRANNEVKPERLFPGAITIKQSDFLASLFKGKPLEVKRQLWNELKEQFKIESIEMLPAKHFQEVLDKLRA